MFTILSSSCLSLSGPILNGSLTVSPWLVWNWLCTPSWPFLPLPVSARIKGLQWAGISQKLQYSLCTCYLQQCLCVTDFLTPPLTVSITSLNNSFKVLHSSHVSDHIPDPSQFFNFPPPHQLFISALSASLLLWPQMRCRPFPVPDQHPAQNGSPLLCSSLLCVLFHYSPVFSHAYPNS